MIRAQLDAERWKSLFRGVYLTTTGQVPIQSWWWAGHLLMGGRSYLLGESALQAWGLRAPELPVRIGVPWSGHRVPPSTTIKVSRHRLVPPVRRPDGAPATERADYAVVDAVQSARSWRYVADLVTLACQREVTTPSEIRNALNAHRRVRFRQLVKDLLVEVEGGSTTVLEVDAVRIVLRPHGLPTGSGQSRERTSTGAVFRDRVIDGFGVVLEFDGRRGHSDPTSRLRDFRRDNEVAASGRTTLRFGWADVHEDPCEVALQIAQVLRSRGWGGLFTPCGPACRATRRPTTP